MVSMFYLCFIYGIYITAFSFIYYFQYLCANYRHLYCLDSISLLPHLVITRLVIDFIITM